jgi:uncharacterized protein (TIGR02145 family)
MKNKSLLMTITILIIAMSSVAQVTGTFTDSRDGKVYKTVTIGTQTWMAENLAYKTSRGCWAYDDDKSNVAIYGYLYDLETAKNECPSGWHLPSDDEWTTLTDYIGGESDAGGKLKETGTAHWNSPNAEATNTAGFAALPGGLRIEKKAFFSMGTKGQWWSSTVETEDGMSFGYYREMIYDYGFIGRYSGNQTSFGLSVRCVKDK